MYMAPDALPWTFSKILPEKALTCYFIAESYRGVGGGGGGKVGRPLMIQTKGTSY